MRRIASPSANEPVRQTCQRIVRELIRRHNWSLLSPEELVEHVLHATEPTSTPTEIEQTAKNSYSAALYDACRQSDNPDMSERAYLELSRYLYRAAHNRWPEHAEDITQQALLLVHQCIDRCRHPERFRTFAVYMVLWARKELAGTLRDDTALDQAENDAGNRPHDSVDSSLIGGERLQVVVDAIGRLPDERRRKVVFLKFFRKMSDSEIGKQLGLTVTNVRVLRNRALHQLRDDPVLRTYFEPTADAPRKEQAVGRCNLLAANGSP